jgi:hypothetical protein
MPDVNQLQKQIEWAVADVAQAMEMVANMKYLV